MAAVGQSACGEGDGRREGAARRRAHARGPPRLPVSGNPAYKESHMPNEIDDVLQRHAAELLALPNVVTVGIGERDGQPTIVVGVTEMVSSAELAPEERVPETLEGHEVDVQELGTPVIELPEEGRHG